MTQRFLLKITKVVFVASSLSFLLIQLHLRAGEERRDEKGGGGRGSLPEQRESLPAQRLAHPAQRPGPSPRNETSPSLRKAALPVPGVAEIRHSIEFNNLYAEIRNEDKFGRITDPNANLSTVIVVQVHDRAKYLAQLVKSLGEARGIERALLIFSHDYYSLEINAIIKEITFCRVMQIFYPYSIQVFPNRFPGQDPRDCEPNIGKEKAKETQCLNWEWPDKYGHYRVARYTQIKHHWWWKMNYVFDGIARLRGYTGFVLLLEEDHFVSPDFLHVFNYIVSNKQTLCGECGVISLGFYLKSYAAYGANIAKLAVYPWFSSRHNMGMALNRATWDRIRNCSKLFCTYDDYNWDWSLMRVNMACLAPNKLTVLYAKSPRVFHIGDCGVHHKCTADTSAQKYTGILREVAGSLFPAQLQVSERSKRMLRPPKENGGWGDVRDHELCNNNTRSPLPPPGPFSPRSPVLAP